MKTCLWHECGRSFEPTAPRQEYCCADCRIKRAKWAKMRGSRLVNILVSAGSFPTAKLKDERAKLLAEIAAATKSKA